MNIVSYIFVFSNIIFPCGICLYIFTRNFLVLLLCFKCHIEMEFIIIFLLYYPIFKKVWDGRFIAAAPCSSISLTSEKVFSSSLWLPLVSCTLRLPRRECSSLSFPPWSRLSRNFRWENSICSTRCSCSRRRCIRSPLLSSSCCSSDILYPLYFLHVFYYSSYPPVISHTLWSGS